MRSPTSNAVEALRYTPFNPASHLTVTEKIQFFLPTAKGQTALTTKQLLMLSRG